MADPTIVAELKAAAEDALSRGFAILTCGYPMTRHRTPSTVPMRSIHQPENQKSHSPRGSRARRPTMALAVVLATSLLWTATAARTISKSLKRGV